VADVIERIPRRVIDVGLAVLVTVLATWAALDADRHPLAVGAVIAGSVVLVVRRRHPLPVLAVVAGLSFALALAESAGLVASVLVSMYTVGALVPRRTSLSAAAVALTVVGAGLAIDGNDGPFSSLPMVVFIAAAWVLGDSARVRSERNEQRARDAVARERARIARELHDIVTHNVSVMVVQAAAGNEVFEEQPERAREALAAVEQVGRRALGELRRLLDVVAEDEGEGEGTLPQPGLARLAELVENVRAAGLAVDLTIEGTPQELAPGVDLSAYRIVQEALTNTLKHARASRALVRVRYAPAQLELDVRDDGIGGTVTPGRGLVGMRERVAFLGGELEAGSTPSGGFVVRARIPVGAT
jgi:signal transduction histidine kinase